MMNKPSAAIVNVMAAAETFDRRSDASLLQFCWTYCWPLAIMSFIHADTSCGVTLMSNGREDRKSEITSRPREN